jgi:hypothetical protein
MRPLGVRQGKKQNQKNEQKHRSNTFTQHGMMIIIISTKNNNIFFE